MLKGFLVAALIAAALLLPACGTQAKPDSLVGTWRTDARPGVQLVISKQGDAYLAVLFASSRAIQRTVMSRSGGVLAGSTTWPNGKADRWTFEVGQQADRMVLLDSQRGRISLIRVSTSTTTPPAY